MTLSAELEALRDDAEGTTCIDWAERQGWTLKSVSGVEKAGPCPKCGGNDRFSINTTKNLWSCRGCGVGGGIIFLVQHVDDLKFVAACERITGRTAQTPVDPEKAERMRLDREADAKRRATEAADYREKARKRGHAIWVEKARPAEAHEPLILYLARRGISLSALTTKAISDGGGVRNLRQALYLDYVTEVSRDGRRSWEKLHCGPAQVVCVQQPDDRFGAVHQTWIDLGRDKGKVHLLHPFDTDKAGQPLVLPSKKVLGVKQGSAGRLFTPPGARRMVMGEGIETTLTPLAHAFQPETAYWSGIDLGNMSGKALRVDGRMVHDQPDMTDLDCFQPPDWVEELIYLVDETDEPQKHIREKVIRGLRRAKRLRDRRRAAGDDVPPLAIFAAEPDVPGKDFNDLAMVDDEGAE